MYNYITIMRSEAEKRGKIVTAKLGQVRAMSSEYPSWMAQLAEAVTWAEDPVGAADTTETMCPLHSIISLWLQPL